MFLLYIIVGCSNKRVKWPINGTTIEATKYKIALSDSSKILTKNGDSYILLSPNDSLLVSKFTIHYSAVDTNANLYFRSNAERQVKNTLNPNLTEYYKSDNGNVLFVGYSSGDSSKPYTIFEPPLIISPQVINKEIKSTGVMRTFIKEKNAFDEGFKTKLTVKEIGEIKLFGKTETYSLRELTLSRDATISYGENNLIVPEAIMFRTKLLVDQNGYPVAEWSVKAEKSETAETMGNEEKRELYIELIKYKEIISGRN